MRHDAAIVLRALPNSLDFTNCSALAANIKLLFSQIFPLSRTDEIEPLSMLDACKFVHLAMEHVRNTQGFKRTLVVELQNYSAYDHSDHFSRYLEASLHVDSSASVALCQEYISAICDHLESAHTMYVQTHSLTASVAESAGANRNSVDTGTTSSRARSRSRGGNDTINSGSAPTAVAAGGQPSAGSYQQPRARGSRGGVAGRARPPRGPPGGGRFPPARR